MSPPRICIALLALDLCHLALKLASQGDTLYRARDREPAGLNLDKNVLIVGPEECDLQIGLLVPRHLKFLATRHDDPRRFLAIFSARATSSSPFSYLLNEVGAAGAEEGDCVADGLGANAAGDEAGDDGGLRVDGVAGLVVHLRRF
jgi:hypothetical protein